MVRKDFTYLSSIGRMSVITVTLICISYLPIFLNATASDNSLVRQHDIDKASISIQNTSLSNFGFNPVLYQRSSIPGMVLFNNQSGLFTFWLEPFSKDIKVACQGQFQCINSSSAGWNDYTSFEVSTLNNTVNTWSMIHGPSINVETNDFYQVITHIKMNKWAQQSHIIIEGFNKSSTQWYQIKQCPTGINGPVEWREFNCIFAIPENVTAIRPVLNAGWSSHHSEKAITWFDSLYLIKSSPFIFDANLKAESILDDLKSPTAMVFLDNKILVTEKNGTIQSIDYTKHEKKTVFETSVLNNAPERGLFGIAATKRDKYFIFIYYTSSNESTIHNRLIRYEFANNSFINPKILLDNPAGYQHNGGKLLIGPDNYLYIVTGEAKDQNLSRVKNTAVNYQDYDTNVPDGRAGILRIGLDGSAPSMGILGGVDPLNKYYAYGIRNSFGMDFDPLTGKLWDTENGPAYDDEMNLVNPGFNSGWEIVQGTRYVANRENVQDHVDNLTDFNGKGKYSPPEFTWNHTVGPTALKFVSTDKLGKQYQNDIFVSDIDNGRIYHFELNHNRTALLLKGPLADKVADSDSELADVIFAEGFGMITDLEIGPDGYLYILSYDQGKIYKLEPGRLNQNIIDYLDRHF